MTNKSKNKVKKTYVEIRRETRLKEKKSIRDQLAGGDFKSIAMESGLAIGTVYKALNAKQDFWSQRVIEAAKAYIVKRDGDKLTKKLAP